MPARKDFRDELVHIGTAPNEPIAKLWAQILEEEGIHSLIRSTDSIAAIYIPTLPTYEIRVLASQAAKAKEILASLREEAAEELED